MSANGCLVGASYVAGGSQSPESILLSWGVRLTVEKMPGYEVLLREESTIILSQ